MTSCPTPRTYFVISPETLIRYASELEPPEYGRYVDEVKASSKREAIRVAYDDPNAEIHKWVKVNRGDGKYPFSGLTVEHPHCEHDTCCDLADDTGFPDCAECRAALDAEDRENDA